MLDHLILVIDEVDKCVDELPEKSQRDELTQAMLETLSVPLVYHSIQLGPDYRKGGIRFF